jgi:beta-lactamase class A
VTTPLLRILAGPLALAATLIAPAAQAQSVSLEREFDKTFGTKLRAPREVPPSVQASVRPFVYTAPTTPRVLNGSLESQLMALADAGQGRIGVAAIDLASGRTMAVLGDQPFPMASTSKIAIVATFLDGVDKGRYKLDDQYPIMVPLRSAKFSSARAPVRAGQSFSARHLIERTLIYSDNQTTDALLAVVGGPSAVNRWMRDNGVTGMRIDRDIATLVRDDGEHNPATTIDPRDSATPLAMAQFLAGLHQGRWLSDSSRRFLLATMERCATGKNRIPGQMPADVRIAHKTGTLSNTSSDVGIIQSPDGRAIAVAIYVTGQGSKPARYGRIAMIARAIYDGYRTESSSYLRSASR